MAEHVDSITWIPMTTAAGKNAICNTCTIRLVNAAYQRAPWFRLVREPLKWGMHFLALLYRVDPDEYVVRTPSCYRCMRFYKVALKERSGLFRYLNDRINPLFDALIERIVPPTEVQQARSYARSAMEGQLETNEDVSKRTVM